VKLLVDEGDESAECFDVESLSKTLEGFVWVERLVDRRLDWRTSAECSVILEVASSGNSGTEISIRLLDVGLKKTKSPLSVLPQMRSTLAQ